MMDIHNPQPPPIPPKSRRQSETFKSIPQDGLNEELSDKRNQRSVNKESVYGEIGALKAKKNTTWTSAKDDKQEASQMAHRQSDAKRSFSLNSRKANGIAGKIASAFSEPVVRRSDSGFKITSWADKSNGERLLDRNTDEEFFYQNVSNSGTNYIEYKLNHMIGDQPAQSRNAAENNGPGFKLGNNKVSNMDKASLDPEKSELATSTTWKAVNNRQIQVHQVKNKTVVKISINDTPSDFQNQRNYFKPLKEEDISGSEYQYPELLFNGKKPVNTKVNEYAEPFVPKTAVYTNIDLSKKTKKKCDGQIYENTDIAEDRNEQFYQNICGNNNHPSVEVYANLDVEAATPSEHHYLNISSTVDSSCGHPDGIVDDQVYENEDFSVLRGSSVTQSIIQKNPLPTREDVYENTDFFSKSNVLDEIKFSGPGVKEISGYQTPKSALRLVVNEPDSDMFKFGKKNQCVITQNYSSQERTMDDGQYSPSETFDSGTSSDVENNAPCSIKQSPKVIVTINGQLEEKGHKRAASITSSGVGVDSEVSDTEESNISCDSLNSNDLTSYSVTEDHGYHTPTSENKTGSPIDGMEYQNIDRKGASPEPTVQYYENTAPFKIHNHSPHSDGTDIIQQVANANARLKNLRIENAGVFVAKRIECEEVYENFNVCEGISDKAIPIPPPQPQDNAEEPAENDGMKTLPKGLLRDIRSRNVRLLSTYPNGETSRDEKALPESITKIFQVPHNQVKELKSTSILKSNSKKVEEKRVVINERTYEERTTETNRICGMELDTDKFYKFHLFENAAEPVREKNLVEDESFAGFKDYLNRERSSTITSAKGTIRGVKNRVKAGIATFLQLQENKLYKDKDAGKIVVYSTTMGIVRDTYHKCLKVKQILKTLMVKFEERDVFMSTEAQEEIRERMKCSAILVPQVYVEGQHIGDAETIERLNESGELRKILKPYKSADASSTCNVCGGYRLLPCRVCKGSKKSVHRNHFTAEFVSLKCMNCDSVGLMKCYAC